MSPPDREPVGLPERVRNWSGAGRLVDLAAAAGLHAPERWLRFTAAQVGETYERWKDEMQTRALLYFRSGGTAAAARWERLVALEMRIATAPALLMARAAATEEWLRAESGADPSDERFLEGWSDKRIHLRAVAQRMAKEEGIPLTRAGYWIDCGQGFRLVNEIDAGRPGSRIQSLAVYQTLREEASGFSMPAALQILLPGMGVYGGGPDPMSTIRAIRAYLVATKALASTL